MHRAAGLLRLAMPRLGPRVRVMAIITGLEARVWVLVIIMVREARNRIVQDETNPVVVRVRLPIRFNGLGKPRFLPRTHFSKTLSLGSVQRAFRPFGRANTSNPLVLHLQHSKFYQPTLISVLDREPK